MKSRNAVLIALVGTLTSGCAAFTSPARMHPIAEDSDYWFDYAAERRGALLVAQESGRQVCAEPSPDVALSVVSKLNLSAELPEDSVKAKAESETRQEVIQLAQRSQMLMFLRESLYRLCELSINQDLDEEQVLKQYEKVIVTAYQMAEVEMTKEQRKIEEAQLEMMRIKSEVTDILDEPSQ